MMWSPKQPTQLVIQKLSWFDAEVSKPDNMHKDKGKKDPKIKINKNKKKEKIRRRKKVVDVVSCTAFVFNTTYGKWRLNSCQRSLIDDLLRGISSLPMEFWESRESRRGSSKRRSAGLGTESGSPEEADSRLFRSWYRRAAAWRLVSPGLIRPPGGRPIAGVLG